MAAHFVLKRYLPEFGEGKMDLYEAIKTGIKNAEYRNATPYWAKRLLSDLGLKQYREVLEGNKNKLTHYVFSGLELKHIEATFRVGYTRGPTLHATIRDIIWSIPREQFVVRIENVREYT